MKFESPDDEAKAADAKKYIAEMGISEKAALYKMMMLYGTDNTRDNNPNNTGGQMGGAMATDETGMATMLDVWLENDPDKEVLLAFYDQYIAGSTYEDNMNLFGKVSYDAPASISIYTDSFEDKDAIATCIENYNETVSERSTYHLY